MILRRLPVIDQGREDGKMTTSEQNRPIPRIPKGFKDTFADDVVARRTMIETIRGVYERYGFEPLETSAVEYVEVLGKFLPESDTPEGGIFAFDDDGEWNALRYDLTAPLARVVAQYGNQLPMPFRRYQVGPVWRREKPDPGRFREFIQFDIDTVGTASMAADAEVCAVVAESLEALGLQRGNYIIRVNNRKVLNGVLEAIGLSFVDPEVTKARHLAVFRAIDKLDRVGVDGVRELLGEGRRDPSGDFTAGAQLDTRQADLVLQFVQSGGHDRAVVCAQLAELVEKSRVGREGVQELQQIHELLEVMGFDSDRVAFDPSIVRGLEYYTGPVFEATLTFESADQEGRRRPFGSVAGGGRYDDLVQRFTGTLVPATGFSIGVDRLLTALKTRGGAETAAWQGPVVVTIMDPHRFPEYQRMVTDLRTAGVAAELYLGAGNMRRQLQYADKRKAPIAVIAGEDEFARNEVSLKDLRLGRELAQTIQNRQEWLERQPAQVAVAREDLVSKIREILARAASSA
jgi:histidyl-tRNA synthetase